MMGTTAQKLNKVLATKEEIRQAIVDRGVECDTDVVFADYPDKIREISGGGITPPLTTGWYGIQFDITVANSACTRIGDNMGLHVTLPIQSKMRRCLLTDGGNVNYYLDENDSTKKEDGVTPAVLDGTDGQVMVEIPEHYRKFETDGNIVRVMLSEQDLSGFHLVPKCYRSAYEAAIDRTNSGAPKLASVVNTAAAFRGGNNTSTWDGTYRSLLGMPASNVSLTNFRNYARNRGLYGKNNAGWNCEVYDIQKTCYWLYIVEYADRNCQLQFNAQPTMDGWKQGGLGDGVTTLNSTTWSTYNGSNPIIQCGHTNSLGNNTGTVPFTMPSQYGSLTVQVSSYRGLENPFGHLWSWTDGCKCRIQSGSGVSEFYICNDPSKFQDSDYNDYVLRGVLPRANGYIKEMLIGEFGENMPKVATGASSTTYFCDQLSTTLPSAGEAQMGVLLSGRAINGAAAGLAIAGATNAASDMGTTIGSRLCFIP